MRARITQVLKTSRKTSKSASLEVCRGSRDAAFRSAQFERAKYVASEYTSETSLEISQMTVGPDMNGHSISHPTSASQSSASTKTPIPLPAATPGDSRK